MRGNGSIGAAIIGSGFIGTVHIEALRRIGVTVHGLLGSSHDRGVEAATATVERSGAMQLNGGSVAHLHTHFVALDESPETTVRFRVSARAD